MSNIPGIPIAMVAIGGVLIWSGIENEPVTAILRSLSQGKVPSKGNAEVFASPAASDGTSPGGGSVPPSDSAIANDALKYEGHPYHYGGYYYDPAGWDCSSFVNWVLGHDFGVTLPGGVNGYNGQSHGPAVAQYQIWGGASHISKSIVQAGDLILFTTVHMGIAVSATQMISAEDPANGTRVDLISAGPGPWNAIRVQTLQTNPGPSPTTKKHAA